MAVGYNRGFWESNGWATRRGAYDEKNEVAIEPSNGDCGVAVRWRRLKPTLLNGEKNEVAMLAKQ